MTMFSADGRGNSRIRPMSVNCEKQLPLVYGFVGSTAPMVADVRDAIEIC
jgi:hypothetical protein